MEKEECFRNLKNYSDLLEAQKEDFKKFSDKVNKSRRECVKMETMKEIVRLNGINFEFSEQLNEMISTVAELEKEESILREYFEWAQDQVNYIAIELNEEKDGWEMRMIHMLTKMSTVNGKNYSEYKRKFGEG